MRRAFSFFVATALAVPAAAQTAGPSLEPPVASHGQGRLPGRHDAEEGRRTLGAFPRNLGRSFVGVFSKDSLAPFVIGATATGVGSLFDARVQMTLSGSATTLGSVGQTAGGAAVMAPLAGGLFLAGRFSTNDRFRAATYDLTQALIVDSVYVFALKEAVRRQRPDGSDRLSFPSGHASGAFALATVAEKHYGWKVGLPAYLVASAVGVSRIENDRHHLSDVLAGAALGYVVGRTVVRENDESGGHRSQLAVLPATDARGTGLGLRLSLAW